MTSNEEEALRKRVSVLENTVSALVNASVYSWICATRLTHAANDQGHELFYKQSLESLNEAVTEALRQRKIMLGVDETDGAK